jgi:hypothetical protein
MSLARNLSRLARSPQGRRLAAQAVRAAKDPKTRGQMEQVRRRFAAKGGRPAGTGEAGAERPEPPRRDA